MQSIGHFSISKMAASCHLGFLESVETKSFTIRSAVPKNLPSHYTPVYACGCQDRWERLTVNHATTGFHGGYYVTQMHSTGSTLVQSVELFSQCCEFSFNIQACYLVYVTARLNWCRRRNATYCWRLLSRRRRHQNSAARLQ